MENISKKKVKTEIADFSGDNNKISLYLGASGVVISLAAAFFLYRELTSVKKSLGDVKQLKNQLTNMDSKFEDMDEQLKKVLNIISQKPQMMAPRNFVPPNQPVFTQKPLNVPLKNKKLSEKPIEINVSEDIEGESESESESENSEISYESD